MLVLRRWGLLSQHVRLLKPLDAETLLGPGKTAGPPPPTPEKMLQSPWHLSGRPCPCPFQSDTFSVLAALGQEASVPSPDTVHLGHCF